MATRTCPMCLRRVPDDEPMVRQQVQHQHGRIRWAAWEAVCRDCLPPDRGYVERQGVTGSGSKSIFVAGAALTADPLPCASCNLPVQVAPDKRRKVTTCSDTCRSRLYSRPRVTDEQHICQGCGEPMTGRSDRRYCSSACRQRAYRQRVG